MIEFSKQSLIDTQVIVDGRHAGWIEKIGPAHYSLHIGFALSFHKSMKDAKAQAVQRCAGRVAA